MDNGSTCEEQNSALYLKVANQKQLRQFLKAIQPEFLRVVYPRESGLLDCLCANNLLTDTDQESMSDKDVLTRKHQARKLWFLLNKMSVPDFVSSVFPVLLKQFRHIIPGEFLTSEVVDAIPTDNADHVYCLRHEIMNKIRVITMADLLYHHDHLGFEDYEDIASGPVEADTVWTKMFQLACRDGDQTHSFPQLLQGLHNLLKKYKVAVPENLQDCVSCGIPCTCFLVNPPALPVLSSNPLRKASSWVKKSPFGCTTPQSTPRSSRRSGASSDRDDDFQVFGSGTSLNPGSTTSSSAPQDDFSDPTGWENMSTVEEEEENLIHGLAPVATLLPHDMKHTDEETPLLKQKMRQNFAADCSDHLLPVSSDKESVAFLELSDEMSCGKMEASEFPEKGAFAEGVYIPIPEAATSSATPIRGQLAAGIGAESHITGVRPEIYNFVAEVIQAAILYGRNQILENRCFCSVTAGCFIICACLFIIYCVYVLYNYFLFLV